MTGRSSPPGRARTRTVPRIGGNLYKLMEAKLGRPPIDLIKERRSSTTTRRGDGSVGAASFYMIARELTEATGVAVTYESVRRWWEQANQ